MNNKHSLPAYPVVPRLYLIVIATFIAAVSSSVTAAVTHNDVQQALKMLDRELSHRETYTNRREAGIDSLRQRRYGVSPRSKEWFDATMRIARGYSSFNNDSALTYYTEGLNAAVKAGNDSIMTEFRLQRAPYLSISGYIDLAVSELESVDTLTLSDNQKRTYFSCARQAYSYISNYYEGFISTHDYWNNLAVQSQKELLRFLKPGSNEYRLNMGEYLFGIREYARSRQILSSLVNDMSPDSTGYAIASHILASIANTRGNQDERIYHLAMSAIADTRSGTLEVTSIQELGGLLFELGDSHRAHEYLVTAMNNVVDSRASVRLSQTSQLLTVIENDHLRQIASYRRIVTGALIILAICVIALIVTIWVLNRQLQRSDRLKHHLEESNKTKDVYMSRFLTLSSIYMDKLKQFSKLVNRKISAGQVDELVKLTKSGKFIEEQSREFYALFDEAFLHIYPNFVTDVNKLLRPEEQIAPAEGELLSSDLRILAFMRLGIDDATRVAQILNYSVNTIYAYRNKLRNRAINRDTFEADIQRIGD